MRALMRVIQNALLAHTPLQVTGLRPKSLNNPQCMHQAIKGLTIMNEQILATGTDRDYAAALDWIKQAAESRTTLPLPGEGPAQEDPVAALLPVITSQHATAIIAQQIRQTLSAPWPAPAQGAAAADHGTVRYAETGMTVSEICAGCGKYHDLPAEAGQVMRVADQRDGTGRVLVRCKDIEACHVRWSSMVTCF